MVEILAGDLDKAIFEIGIKAIKTYQCKNKYFEYQENYQVWEMPKEEIEKLCNIKLSDWKDDWGWFRSATGSVMCNETHRYIINGHYIKAWDGNGRERYDWMKRKYKCLLQYLLEEHGVSTEMNVTALSVDLALMNYMKMSELWQKYMG